MSSIRVNQITDAAGGNSAVLNGVVNAPGGMGFRNRIINGDMRISQAAAGTVVTSNGFAVDRTHLYSSQPSKVTVQQNAGSVATPTGFTNYLGAVSSSAYAINATDQFLVSQKIEGFNVADLGWGTAGAQPITISFWVRSSLTGTFGGAVQNSAATRNYPFSYSIVAANTWEQKTVTVPGDTTGTWLTNNGNGITLSFSLGTGSTYSATAGAWTTSSFVTSATGATSVVGTSGATWAVTGVQLEAGTVATPFERVDFGTQLMRCQRYFQVFAPVPVVGTAEGRLVVGAIQGQPARIALPVIPVPMRAQATVQVFSRTAVSGVLTEFSSYTDITITSINNIDFTVGAGGGWAQCATNVTNGLMYRATYSAEL